MATTSLDLGEHWESFIQKKIASGQYNSAKDVLRDALREMEREENEFEALRAHLAEGYRESEQGIYVEDFSFEKLIEELDKEDA